MEVGDGKVVDLIWSWIGASRGGQRTVVKKWLRSERFRRPRVAMDSGLGGTLSKYGSVVCCLDQTIGERLPVRADGTGRGVGLCRGDSFGCDGWLRVRLGRFKGSKVFKSACASSEVVRLWQSEAAQLVVVGCRQRTGSGWLVI